MSFSFSSVQLNSLTKLNVCKDGCKHVHCVATFNYMSCHWKINRKLGRESNYSRTVSTCTFTCRVNSCNFHDNVHRIRGETRFKCKCSALLNFFRVSSDKKWSFGKAWRFSSVFRNFCSRFNRIRWIKTALISRCDNLRASKKAKIWITLWNSRSAYAKTSKEQIWKRANLCSTF